MYILGISGGFHSGSSDAAAALLKNGTVIAAAEEERFINVKHAHGMVPYKAIKYCLSQAKIDIKDIDVVVYYVNTYEDIKERMEDFFSFRFGYCPKLKLVNHHHTHQASAFYPSGFEDAMIMTFDYAGDGICTTLAEGKGNQIRVIKEIKSPNSLGIYYALLTQFLGFEMDNDEFKVMGMSSYGKDTVDFSKILDVSGESYQLNPKTIKTAGKWGFSRQECRYSKLFEEVLGKPRLPNDIVDTNYYDIAKSGQVQLEKAALNLLKYLAKNSSSRNLCLAGGVGLNCVMNSALLSSGYVDNIFVEPASCDSGCALGAAYIEAIENGFKIEKMEHVYYGPEFSNEEIKTTLTDLKCNFREIKDVSKVVAQKIAKGKIVGWFQGRMEFGPRALGNRSILADPRSVEMKDKINNLIKFREQFRPFAPAILLEKNSEYFKGAVESPYMTLTFDVLKPGKIPAVTHVDNTSRIQTVRKDINPLYWNVINEFYKITGVPVVLNTSLNVRGQTIACNPKQAITTFNGSGMDCLVIGNFLIEKY